MGCRLVGLDLPPITDYFADGRIHGIKSVAAREDLIPSSPAVVASTEEENPANILPTDFDPQAAALIAQPGVQGGKKPM